MTGASSMGPWGVVSSGLVVGGEEEEGAACSRLVLGGEGVDPREVLGGLHLVIGN